MLRALEVVKISNNLGDAKASSRIGDDDAPAAERRSGEKLGIRDSLIRLSVGLEDPLDLAGILHRRSTRQRPDAEGVFGNAAERREPPPPGEGSRSALSKHLAASAIRAVAVNNVSAANT